MDLSLAEVAKQVFAGLALAIPVSLITSWITVRLALRRFRAERSWDKKAESYATILESLHYMEVYYSRHLGWLENMYRGPEGEERNEALEKRFAESGTEIHRFAALGAFFISEEASKSLDTLVTALEDPEYGGYNPDDLSHHLKAVQSALSDLRQEAKRDLRRL